MVVLVVVCSTGEEGVGGCSELGVHRCHVMCSSTLILLLLLSCHGIEFGLI